MGTAVNGGVVGTVIVGGAMGSNASLIVVAAGDAGAGSGGGGDGTAEPGAHWLPGLGKVRDLERAALGLVVACRRMLSWREAERMLALAKSDFIRALSSAVASAVWVLPSAALVASVSASP